MTCVWCDGWDEKWGRLRVGRWILTAHATDWRVEFEAQPGIYREIARGTAPGLRLARHAAHAVLDEITRELMSRQEGPICSPPGTLASIPPDECDGADR